MAIKRQNAIMAFLRRMTGVDLSLSIPKTTLRTTDPQSVSTGERDTIITRLSQDRTPSPAQGGGMDAFRHYIQPLTREIAATKLDNKAIERLAPEVIAAKTIVIPSILSPNDLQDGKITLQSTSVLVDVQSNACISKLLDDHFNHTLKLSEKLADWIDESLYGAGSKPLLVLPITELDTLMMDPDAVQGANESKGVALEALARLQHPERIDNLSIHGIADVAHGAKKTTPRRELDFDQLRPALEAHATSFITEAGLTPKPGLVDEVGRGGSYNLSGKLKSGTVYHKALQSFATEAIAAVSVIDNPDALKVDRAHKAQRQVKVQKDLMLHFKIKTLLTLNPETTESIGNPVVYELPPESVVPLFTPGAPNDHIGYFIAIDEFGNPIHVTQEGTTTDLSDSRRINPAALYKSFGFDSTYHTQGNQSKTQQTALMVHIYQTIIEAHLNNRLKDSGFDNVYIGSNENVYRCMFARYMQLRKTRLLFVPRDLMTYFCFKYNENGTGRSKLEDIKFILSLKITILVCRIMASMNAAINRRKITVNFDPKMGDPIAYMEMIKKEAIDKAIVNFSYDPTDITRTLAQRSLTVEAHGIPGAENFSISQDANEHRSNHPDETLNDDLNNLMILALDVPPSAMNMLNENEFSRSVATNNLFFSRRMAAYQKIVCRMMARHVQIYTTMSQTLKDEIRKILHQGDGKDKTVSLAEGAPEAVLAGDAANKTRVFSIDEKLIDVIQHIQASLPAPSIAPNKTELDEFDALVTSLGTTLDAVFDNDLASDDPIPLIRSLVKSDILREYMKRIGLSRDIKMPEIDATTLSHLMEFKLTLENIKKGLKQTVDKITPVEDQGFGVSQSEGGPDTSFGSPQADASQTPDEPPTNF